MSLIFGIYTSLIGIAIVFITLLIVAAASEILRKILGEKIDMSPIREEEKLLKIAAIAAVHHYTSQFSPQSVKMKAGISRWSTQARVEALKMRGDRPG
jgi:hypothetical protein